MVLARAPALQDFAKLCGGFARWTEADHIRADSTGELNSI